LLPRLVKESVESNKCLSGHLPTEI
jgi:hypothetical protein